MRRILSLLAFLVTLGAVLAAGAFFFSYKEFSGAGPLQETALFTVEQGQGVGTIARKLAQEGVINEPLLFRIAARLTKTETQIHAGEYEFPPRISMALVLQKLAAGDVVQRKFTIPEGLTSWQIVKILNDTPELSGEITDIPAEGSLLPETYNFARGETRAAKIAQMQDAMKKTLAELWAAKPDSAPLLSEAEVIILASIVEKETAVPDERRRIAGVFVNRLKKGMALQTDPTVIYAITGGKIEDKGQGPLGRRLLTKDLQFDSPYNTYKYPGLPPGPIANPGRASIEAVLNPEQHEFYYFVADGTGGHVFSKTLEEHNANVAKWRVIRKQQGN